MITTTPVRFEIPKDAAWIGFETLDDWTTFGRGIIARAESATWDLADWAAYAVHFGKKNKGEEENDWHTLKDFCEAHGLNYGSTRVYACVARGIPMLRRLNTLSFAHHQEVVALDEAQQDQWLRDSSENHWSVSELRRRIRESLGDRSAKQTDGFALELPTKHALDLHHWLTQRPADFWTDSSRAFWKEQIKPLVEFWEGL